MVLVIVLSFLSYAQIHLYIQCKVLVGIISLFVFQAALCLHEEEAVYPAKLQFTTMPPHLALEALEVFFRIQVNWNVPLG